MQLETMGHGDLMVADLALGKKIMEVLEKHYTFHNWFVDVNLQAGHCSIQLMYEGNNLEKRIWKYGFLLHVKDLLTLDEIAFEKKIMSCGGEVLERYGITRRRAKENDIFDFITGGYVDETGMVLESRK